MPAALFLMFTLALIVIVMASCCCDSVLGLAAARNNGPSIRCRCCRRREAFLGILSTTTFVAAAPKAFARAPGSKDLVEAVAQIRDAARDLRKLHDDWALYSVIDDEGRAGSTDGARRVLGGIAPQAGTAAIEAAKKTPLYRIDVAFVTVRKAALEGDEQWASANLDLDRFEDLAERILYEIQKADGNFYSVLFAAKGTAMIRDIFVETRSLIKQGISDFDQMLLLLKDAGAPGL